MAEKQEINTNSDTTAESYFRYLTVTFNSYTGIKQPHITNADKFYKIYSSEKFKLRPREDIYLDLKFNVKASKELDPWISLLPSLKGCGLTIANQDKTKDNTIQLHLLNQSFTYTINIKKKQCIAFIFLLGESSYDIIKTEYTSINYNIVN